MVRQNKENITNLQINAIKLNAKFAHIIMPFDINSLQRVLIGLKYILETQQIRRGIMAGELGPAILPARIATREDLEVEYSIDKQVLGIGGNNNNKVLDAFTELITTIKQIIEPVELKVSFYETLILAIGNGSRSPLQTFASGGNKLKIASQLDEIFGEEVAPFGLRLSPSKHLIDTPDWFEYRIEPFLLQPEGIYSIVFIYRNNKLDKAKEAILKFEDISRKLIHLIEK
jgi:hypothetical protein